jgi:thiamine pyrophosphate-dependent acetolactate synthase large subunit-like protein
MARIEIYDPPLCCPTGICGPSVDPVLVRFAADLEWLKEKGVEVKRYNLAQQPEIFAASELVKGAMTLAGELCLPLIVVGGSIVSRNKYPERAEMASLLGINTD